MIKPLKEDVDETAFWTDWVNQALRSKRMIDAVAIGAAINLLYEVFKKINKDKSEKFTNEWEKDLPELTKAVKVGDIDTIARITAKYSLGL